MHRLSRFFAFETDEIQSIEVLDDVQILLLDRMSICFVTCELSCNGGSDIRVDVVSRQKPFSDGIQTDRGITGYLEFCISK